MVHFSNNPGRDLESALSREWLETNGIGGFASSTIVGLNTRRYHGLLTAATKPPLGRYVLLSKFEESVLVDGTRFELSCNEYPGGIYPKAHVYVAEFRIDPFPTFVYRCGAVLFTKEVFAVHGENTTVVRYEADAACRLELRPLVAFRDYHSLTHQNDVLDARVKTADGVVTIAPYRDLPALYFAHSDEIVVEATGQWYYRFQYRIERERGLDYEEDLFNPFLMRIDLAGGRGVSIVVSTERRDSSDAENIRVREADRRAGVRAQTPFAPLLALAADQFIVQRGELETVIAGYHWFSDWGRDTMIALPGLTLTTGRIQTASKILLAFAGAVSEGMLPNRWPDAGDTPEYNSADATLWFFDAVGQLVRHTRDYQFLDGLLGTLKSIVEWHVHGTRFGIRVRDDGLLHCGEPGSNLTWMDARVNGVPVTPRTGLPVEIQALWYNALRWMESFYRESGRAEEAERYRAMASRADESFQSLFWNEQSDCLYDVVSDDGPDASIRPNQIFAVSLTHPIVEGERARMIVDCVRRELLTPFGLRSLNASNPQYVGQCVGDVPTRDGAYHQGTVWSWLLGPFVAACMRVYGKTPEAVQRAREWLKPIQGHLYEAGLGQISEIFDGDAPHAPRGCIAQAWSVGEILRVVAGLERSQTSQEQW